MHAIWLAIVSLGLAIWALAQAIYAEAALRTGQGIDHAKSFLARCNAARIAFVTTA